MTAHQMRLAKVSPRVGKRLGLNSNHHVRVWCECMADQKAPPGFFPSGLYWTTRPTEVVANDPRRLGGWDALGYADVRDFGAASAIFAKHVTSREGTDG